MSLLEKWFGKKNSEPVAQQATQEILTQNRDAQLAAHHTEIEQNIASATNEHIQPGSSVPIVNTQPQIKSPLAVIQGPNPEDQRIETEAVIASTMPASYKKISVGDTFGSGMKNTIDHLTGLDSNRYTTAGKFTEVMKEKAQNQSAVLQPSELKKAA